MTTAYQPEFREQAVQKALQRGSRTIQSVADELNINFGTLQTWLKLYRKKNIVNNKHQQSHAKRPNDWTPAQRLQALLETHALTDDETNAWCREKGIFNYHLRDWKADFEAGNGASSAASATDSQSLKKEIKRLNKDLQRKEKALAESAALLVLQKKYNSLWEDEVR